MRRIFFTLTIYFVSFSIFAQVDADLLNQGISYLRRGKNNLAANMFRSIVKDNNLQNQHQVATYWLIKTDLLAGNYQEASQMANRYLVSYPNNSYTEEVFYHSARIFFLQKNYQKSIVAFRSFIKKYPRSRLVSSAEYWIGESLVLLGNISEADKIFTSLINRYPGSVKFEEAQYRKKELSLMYREKELLDLLRWSHEEYIRETEAYIRKEEEYKRIIDDYQTRLEERGPNSENENAERALRSKEKLLKLKELYVKNLQEILDVQKLP